MTKYLTKSKYQLAMQCPTKLYYASHNDYVNKLEDNSFLEALAEGGHQVGELAKCYFPDGQFINSLNIDEAINQTRKLLKLDNVVIFEAAIVFEQCLVRVDVLEKIGNSIRIIEVKAKSCVGSDSNQFLNKNGDKIQSGWKPYIEDVAFQKWVVKSAFPQSSVVAKLMLVNKSSTSEVSGLNQSFRISNEDNITNVSFIGDAQAIRNAKPLLIAVSADSSAQMIYDEIDINGRNYSQRIVHYCALINANEKAKPVLTSKCSACEFRVAENDLGEGEKSGFLECWKQVTGLSSTELSQPLSIDVWNSRKKNDWLESGIYLMSALDENDIAIKAGDNGLSQSERQWKQVEKNINNDDTPYLDVTALQHEVDSWTYPLHFIDFETNKSAIPFHEGRRPYEQIAFQYSHHQVEKDGSVKHAGQFLNTEPTEFPNYDFVRSLKAELSQDNGTVFMFFPHENRVLNDIYNQLDEDVTPPADKNELQEFIISITEGSGANKGCWQAGERMMVDLCELVKRFYYDPLTGGSNSIKQVLPAVLARSKLLQDIYSKPIYGNQGGISSLNFNNHAWFSVESVDPYKSLEKIFNDIDSEDVLLLSSNEDIADGGAAMTAYAYLQYSDMSDQERQALRDGLLRYCELDTMAMVMIYQAWMDWLGSGVNL